MHLLHASQQVLIAFLPHKPGIEYLCWSNKSVFLKVVLETEVEMFSLRYFFELFCLGGHGKLPTKPTTCSIYLQGLCFKFSCTRSNAAFWFLSGSRGLFLSLLHSKLISSLHHRHIPKRRRKKNLRRTKATKNQHQKGKTIER